MTKIMFVDDEPAILDGLRRNLKRMDGEWEMHFLPSGREALQRLQGTQFDAIVTDVRMPEMDGVELLEEVSKRYPHMLRMVLTGHSDRRELLQSGTLAHQYLMKPTDADFLSSVIKTQLILSALTRPKAPPPTAAASFTGMPLPSTTAAAAPRGFDINEAIRHAINRTKNEWEKIAQVSTDLDGGIPRLTYLESELPMTLLNFMVNAAHAVAETVEKGGGQGKINLSTSKTPDGGVEIRISDTGPGIPEHVRAKAFEWIAKEPLRSGPGAWLVLAHAMLVEKHGGSISIDSVIGRGTTYIIRMPATSRGR